MKKCGSCGTRQSDSRFFCIDCGTKLGKRLSSQEEAALEQKTSAELEKLNIDLFHVSLRERVISFCSVLGVAASIAVMVLLLRRHAEPRLAIFAIVFFMIAGLETFAPKLLWNLMRLRLSLFIHNIENTEPSDSYLLTRKGFIYVGFIIAILLLVGSFLILADNSSVVVVDPNLGARG